MFTVRSYALLPLCRKRGLLNCNIIQSNFCGRDENVKKHDNYEIIWTGRINYFNFVPGRNFNASASQCQQIKEKPTTAVASSKETKAGELTLGQKVKETTKNVSYLGVIIGGISVTALMFYAIFRELFSGRSPNSVYSKALKRCCEDSRIIEMAGEPIKGYGEETRRGRRRHVAHTEYVKDGVNHMRMKFYIQGSLRKGTVHLEVRENDQGQYEYRYLFVDFEGPLKNTVILEDNRWQQLAI